MKNILYFAILLILCSFILMHCGPAEDGPFLTLERRSSAPSIKEPIIIRTAEDTKIQKNNSWENFLNFQPSIKKDSLPKNTIADPK